MNGLERSRNAALALALCAACSSSTTLKVGSQFAKTGVIGPSGGTLTVTASDDAAIAGTSITIPSGALSAATTIKIGQTNQQVVSSGALGPVIDFEQNVPGTTFAKPVTITIPLNLPAGFNPSRVGVMAVEANKTSHDIKTVTVSGSLVTFQTSSFTDYGAHDEGESDDGGCSATCGDDAACGSSDGCGGACNANCTDAGCTPSCGGDAACGSSDGCGGTCDANCGTDTDGGGTGDGGTDGGCSDATCSDYEGMTCCGASCVNVQTDVNHCGSCDNDCTILGAGIDQLTCTDGHCYCGPSGVGIICPDGTCSTLTSDPNNCGSCGNVCSAPAQDCINGGCACPDSEALCGQPDAGTPLFCIDTTQDEVNCGSCGNICSDTYASNSGCRFGLCTCEPGVTTLCGAAGSAGAACLPNGVACDGG